MDARLSLMGKYYQVDPATGRTKVEEEFEGVSDEVTVATALLQHDHLSVPHDKATEDCKANPHVKL